ncbi:MAG: phosphoribosylglycinamide formyltransferase [Gemmatimonadetes bacterium]|nr:MAG: phosphoribosylglycinamide formyltransferase [Gemmatimonadota bacterium]
MLRIGVLVSGGGTNLQAIMDRIESGYIPNSRITVVISSNPKAYALTRARRAEISTVVISKKEYPRRFERNRALVETLRNYEVDLVLLAGFMMILSEEFIQAYENRIMNVHPSLIPAFCGKGFYGDKVHQAVLDYGVKLTGATVHFVTQEVDAGPIILQKAVPVKNDDTVETLKQRVLEEAEWVIYPEAVKLYAEHRLKIENRRVLLRE